MAKWHTAIRPNGSEAPAPAPCATDPDLLARSRDVCLDELARRSVEHCERRDDASPLQAAPPARRPLNSKTRCS